MNSNQMLVTFDEYEDKWQQCLTALEYDYTLSFRSACKILKCDRTKIYSSKRTLHISLYRCRQKNHQLYKTSF